MWPWRVKMPTQNLLRLLLLLMLMLRIMLATACWFGSWRLVIKLNFCSDFEHKARSIFWRWSSGKIWSWSLVSILPLMFCWGYEVESWLRFWSKICNILNFKFSWDADVLLRFWSWCLVEILKMKFNQDLCLNLWYELNPQVRCVFGNVYHYTIKNHSSQNCNCVIVHIWLWLKKLD